MLKHDLRVLSEQPRIYHLEKFLSFEECDHLIGLAKERLTRSYVVDPHSSNNVIDPARTSRGMTLPKTPEDPIVVSIEQRIASVTEIPVDHGENLQVLHYVVGGEYKPHYDYFDPASPGAAANLVRGGQRIATMIIYLHTTDEGGETQFPLIDVEVKPIKGNAIFFYNCKPDYLPMSAAHELEPLILQVLKEHPQSVADFRAGKDKALGFLVGQVMKLSRGSASPQIVHEILQKKIKE